MHDNITRLCAAGLYIVPIPPENGKPAKGPKGSAAIGWNKPRSVNNPHGYSNNPADFKNCQGYNFGLFHGASNTLALDLDNLTQAIELLEDVAGIPTQAWLKDPERVEIKSPKPNRGKLLFRLSDGFQAVGAKKLTHDGKTIFELRSGNCQDVIHGQHPEGGDYQFIGNPAAIPEAPPVLLDMLTHWDDWKLCFESALGIEQEPPKEAPRRPQQGEHLSGWRDPIDEFNQSCSVADVLLRNGYKQKGKDRFIRPGSESKAPGAVIVQNCKDGIERVYSHGGDVLNDGFAHDAFDCMRLLEYGGDWAAALNWNLEITKHNQRLYRQEQAKAEKERSSSDNKSEPEEVDISGLFDDLMLTHELVEEMANAEFLIPNVIVKGHLAIYAAPANGGKSALFRYFCERLCAAGMEVFYINVDAGADDLKHHYAHATQHGYKVIAPDAHVGKSTEDVILKLRKIVDSGQSLEHMVFILDTLKKFVYVLDKPKAKEFYKLLRALTVRGATVCALGHTNKYPDENGLPIYEGTVDLRNDFDDLIYFDGFLNEATNILEITTRPDKKRALFIPVSFHIDINNNRKVTPIDDVIDVLSKEDREFIDLTKQAIRAGHTTQGGIIDYIKSKSDLFGPKKIKSLLNHYIRGTHPKFKVSLTGFGKTKCYEVI